MKLTTKTFFDKMLVFLPTTEEAYNHSIKKYGKLLETIVIEDIFMPEIIKLLEKEEEHELLEKMFSFFEEVIEYGEESLINNFEVTVLEILGNDLTILKIAQRYMGEKTKVLQIEVDKALGRGKLNEQ